MIVILDTNALLETFSRKSEYHWVFQYFQEKKYQLAVSTDIILEYHEIIARETNVSIAEKEDQRRDGRGEQKNGTEHAQTCGHGILETGPHLPGQALAPVYDAVEGYYRRKMYGTGK